MWQLNSRRRRSRKTSTLAERSGQRLLLFLAISVFVFLLGSATGDNAVGLDASRGGGTRTLFETDSPKDSDENTGNVGDFMCGWLRDVNGSVVKSSIYPTDLFTDTQCRNGALFFHWLGMLYMFLCLSICCDEFFVPALEEMYQNRARIDDDVAGATFMAAGGSAPELATSIIGTFSGSSVGFGTIVGSAVFNVLFVIGACAMASKDTLCLTSYPLARDCSWYIVCLALLAVWFSGSSPGRIDWWEALIQLSMYGAYVTLMVFNKRIRPAFYRTFRIQPELIDPDGSIGDIHLPRDIHMSQMAVSDISIRSCTRRTSNVSFTNKLARLMTFQMDTQKLIAFHAVNTIPGDVRETFDRLDEEKNGRIEVHNIRKLLESLGAKNFMDEDMKAVLAELDTDESGDIDRSEFEHWYKASEQRLLLEMDREFSRIDSDQSGDICVSELRELLLSLDLPALDEDIDELMARYDKDGNGKIDRSEFQEWYRGNTAFKIKQDEAQEALVLDEKGLLAWPDTTFGQFMFIITLPAVLLLISIPDVRKPGKFLCCGYSDWYPVSFIMSIGFIGIFSYFMVWFATTVGDHLKIPDEIMGLTFLAAGTSVPDLLTSVAVAREGHGDMAVSSSIGSNVFDVTVGLPLPWLLYILIYQESNIDVGDSKVGTSIVILLIMLVLVFATISFFHWKLTKTLGFVMFGLYLVFLTVEILRNEALNVWPAFQVINF